MIDQARALAKINSSSWQDILGAVWHLFNNRYLCTVITMVCQWRHFVVVMAHLERAWVKGR